MATKILYFGYFRQGPLPLCPHSGQ